jgi:hypothetical protein
MSGVLRAAVKYGRREPRADLPIHIAGRAARAGRDYEIRAERRRDRAAHDAGRALHIAAQCVGAG